MHLWPGMLYGALKKMTGRRTGRRGAGAARLCRGWRPSALLPDHTVWPPGLRGRSGAAVPVRGRRPLEAAHQASSDDVGRGHAARHLPDPALRVPARRQAGLRRRDGGRLRPLRSRSSERGARAPAWILAGMWGLADVLIFACRARWHGWGTARDSRSPHQIKEAARDSARRSGNDAPDAQPAGADRRHRADAGARHRRHHRDLQRRLRRAAEAAALSRAGPARPGVGIDAVARAGRHVADRSELLGHARHEPVAVGVRRAARRELHAHGLRDARACDGREGQRRVPPNPGRAAGGGPHLRAGRGRARRVEHAGGALARALDPPVRPGREHRRPHDHAGWTRLRGHRNPAAGIAVARRRGRLRAVRAPARRQSHQLGIHRDRPDEARRLLRRRPRGSRARREGTRGEVSGEQGSGRHDAVFAGVDRQRSASADALDAALVGRSAAPDRVRERDQSPARARVGSGTRERRADGARGDARGSDTRAADRVAGLQPRRNRARVARRHLDAGRAAIGQSRRHSAAGGGHPERLGDRVRGVGGAGRRRVDRPHPGISDAARQHPAGAPKRLARRDRRSRTEPPPQHLRLRRSRPVARAARRRRAARPQPHARARRSIADSRRIAGCS